MDRLISPVDGEWNADGAAAAAISGWEHATGLRLPDDYRGFMFRYDGGRPYPNMFRRVALVPHEGECLSEHFLDPFFNWDRVVTWSKELGNRLPPESLAIGADPGLVEIVLSLRRDDYGAVYSWVRNWGVWGSEENSYLCLQAPSFAAFVASLFDDKEGNGYAYWHTPAGERLQRTLDVGPQPTVR
jgi:hypothetical protein